MQQQRGTKTATTEDGLCRSPCSEKVDNHTRLEPNLLRVMTIHIHKVYMYIDIQSSPVTIKKRQMIEIVFPVQAVLVTIHTLFGAESGDIHNAYTHIYTTQ